MLIIFDPTHSKTFNLNFNFRIKQTLGGVHHAKKMTLVRRLLASV